MFEEREKQARARSVFLGRVLILVFFGLLATGLLVARIVFLTMWRGQDLFYLSEQNFLRQEKIPAPRGDVVDRYGRILATSETRFNLSISPFKKIPPNELRRTLMTVKRLCPALQSPSIDSVISMHPVWGQKSLANQLTLAETIPLQERLANLPGLQIDESFLRVYPLGRDTAQLTGYVRKISPKALDSYLEDGYDRDDAVGAAGLEKTQEAYLRGEKGVQVEHRDAMGRLLSSPRVQRNAVQGGRVVLSIDADLQTTATYLLAGRPGAIVAVDPRNGDILAMASNPNYDANKPNLAPGSGDSQFNKALQEHYAPGSTFKLVTATAYLLAGGSPDRRVSCGGSLQVAPGFCPKCNVKWGHGSVNLPEALMVSCNVYFYQLSKEMREEQLYDVARMFGFGRPTGLPVMERGESGGILADPESAAAHLMANRVMMGIGQGELISVTPLQEVLAYSAMANGGTLYAPRIVLRTEMADGRQVSNPVVVRDNLTWTEAQRQVLLKGFRAVVEETRGTASRGRIDPAWRAAGKTGTAQRRKPPDAWFVGFAPWDNPEICVVVLLEKAGHGGEEAAPVANQILKEYFRLKQERPAKPAQLDAKDIADARSGGQASAGMESASGF